MTRFALTILLPTLTWWLGGQAASGSRSWRGPGQAVAIGLVAPAAMVRAFERSPLEQLLAWTLSVVAWGGVFVAGDPMVFAACALVGAAWGGWLGVLTASSRGEAGVPTAPPSPAPRASTRHEPAEHPEAEEAELGFRLSLRCPTCGAEVLLPAYHRMARCGYCNSVHLVEGTPEVLAAVVPDAVCSAEGVKRAVVKHLRHCHYLERYDQVVRPIVARQKDDRRQTDLEALLTGDQNIAANAAEARVEREADAYAEKIAPRVRVTLSRGFLAPYWHRAGTLYQAAFGRDEGGEKQMSFAVTTLETSLAATGETLPEMGKLSYLRALRPLVGSPESALPALPADRAESELDDRLRQLGQRQVELGMHALARHAVFVPEVTALVFRPWYLAEGDLDGAPFSLLVDGGAGEVVGSAPTLGATPRPLDSPGEPSEILVPNRCPDCAGELPFAPDAIAVLCPSCFRLVTPVGARWSTMPYQREEALQGCWSVPFWRFPLRLRLSDGDLVVDLPHLTDGVDGTLDQIGDAPPRPQEFYVPAFRTRVDKSGLHLYRQLWPIVEGRPRELSAERFTPETPPGQGVAVTLPAEEASVFAGVYLALAFTHRDLARADARGVRERFLGAHLEGTPELAFLSVPAEVMEPFRYILGRHRAPSVASLDGTPEPSAP